MSRKLQESSGLGKTNTSIGPIRWMVRVNSLGKGLSNT